METDIGLRRSAFQQAVRTAVCTASTYTTALRLFALLLAASMVCAGLTGYPIPFGDATYFLPAAIQLANGHGLTNPVYAMARDYDALGAARLIYHGFTFEILLAALMKPLMVFCGGASIAAVAALGIMHAGGILVLSECCMPFLRQKQRISLSSCVAALGLTVYSAMILLWAGRPEELAALPVCVIVAAVLSSGISPATIALSGACIGVIASISPVPAALAGVLFATYLASVVGPRIWLIYTLSAGLIAISVFFGLALAIYPYPVFDLVQGIQRHGANVETIVDWHIFEMYVGNPDLPAFGLVLLLAFATGVSQAFRRRGRPERALLAGLLILLTLMLGRLVFNEYMLYNILPVWPALLGLLLWSARVPLRRKSADLARSIVFVIALALPSVGFLRLALLYPIFLQNGMPQPRAQALFARQLAEISDPLLYVSRSVFLLTDHYDRIIDFGDDIPQGKVLVLAQQRSGLTTPEMLPGYRLVYENFNPHPARLFGFTIAHVTPGYQFAIYRPTVTADNPPQP